MGEVRQGERVGGADRAERAVCSIDIKGNQWWVLLGPAERLPKEREFLAEESPEE